MNVLPVCAPFGVVALLISGQSLLRALPRPQTGLHRTGLAYLRFFDLGHRCLSGSNASAPARSVLPAEWAVNVIFFRILRCRKHDYLNAVENAGVRGLAAAWGNRPEPEP